MNNRLKTAFKSIVVTLIVICVPLAWIAGSYGYGCEVKQGVVMCGSKEARLEGCYQ